MIKKIYFAIIVGCFITCTFVVIENSCFDTWLFIICFLFTILFSIGLFNPNFIFKISHWYIDRQLDDCSDFFVFMYEKIIAFALFLFSILQLSLLN